MNMKKTMAAIAAGAVAVSAMATTVSALETKTLHYSLVDCQKVSNSGDASYTVTFPSIALEVTDTVTIDVAGWTDKTEVEVRPSYNQNTYFAPSFTYTENKGSVKYNSAVAAASSKTFNVVENNSATVNNNKNVFVGGTGDAKAEGVGTTVTLTSQTTLNQAATANATLYYIDNSEIQTALKGALATDGTSKLDQNAPTGAAGWYDVDVDTLVAEVKKDATLLAVTSDATAAQVDAAVTAAATKLGTSKQSDAQVGVKYGITVTGSAGNKILIMAGTPALCTVYVDVLQPGYVPSADPDYCGGASFADAAADLDGTHLGVTLTVKDAAGNIKNQITNGSSVLNSYSSSANINKYPYKSTLGNTIYTNSSASLAPTAGTHTGDVFENIYTAPDWEGKSTRVSPISVRAVINDAIQQHNGEVTFIFNTAAEKVKDEKYSDAWDAVDYTSFANHYYQDLQYSYDPSLDYYVNNWKPDNLFNGLLLVNSNLTLSLSDTEKFDWTEKSLAFTWEAITDAALTANQYATYVQNMVLRTSATWYWDSLDVVLADVETAGIGVGAPTDAPEEDIDEEEDEPVEFDEPEDEPEEEPADEPEEEPAEVAPAVVNNPTTGNASVALAVIPVALAAAAIVAKKRG